MGEDRFWDKMADSYARQPIADEAAYQTKLQVTRGYLRPDMEVLEFGCGTGGTAIIHAPHVRHIRAIDFSEAMLTIARGKAASAGVENVTFERADISSFVAPDGSFDMILGMSILHLLADKDAVIAKVFRLLKPGGLFISSTTCLGDTMGLFKLIAPIGKALGLLPQLDVMTTADLVRSLNGAGFSIEHQWQPGMGKAVFIVARAGAAPATLPASMDQHTA
ncbi:class I SAM-dependent methyltransferase [Devosia ginsengisoli]|uniref:class I SAM-dependent methyltransferase n=1 Tax=Devosia ginsengisoli TaxID=400770 RepID=UPI0026EF6447|nr:class I SAM-dependent methyltransferase [Devosia ginsengisoli]MCR6670354.1 class I SAM-dependent methyltransferase [Devosia ginsengisoli]